MGFPLGRPLGQVNAISFGTGQCPRADAARFLEKMVASPGKSLHVFPETSQNKVTN
jgi:hypothetical protein